MSPSQEIADGVNKSAQAVQAAEAGIRQIGTLAHQQTICKFRTVFHRFKPPPPPTPPKKKEQKPSLTSKNYCHSPFVYQD